MIVAFLVLGIGLTLGALAILSPGASYVIAGIPFGAAAGILGEEIRSREERQFHRATQRDLGSLRVDNTELRRTLTQVEVDNQRLRSIVEQREWREQLLERTETSAAYYLGYVATILGKTPNFSDEPYQLISRWCADLGLGLSEAEQLLLDQEVSDESVEEIATMISKKSLNLRPAIRPFFMFGNTAAWMRDFILNPAFSCREAADTLAPLQGNPYLSVDPEFATVVDQLVAVVESFHDPLSDDDREKLLTEVNEALKSVPSIYIQGGKVKTPVRTTKWMWVANNDPQSDREVVAMCMVGPYVVVARDDFVYEIVMNRDGDLKPIAIVHRDEEHWQCSADPGSNEESPCKDIQMVLFVSDGGQPVTEAVVAYVRDTDATNEEGEPDTKSQEDGSG